VDGTEEALIAKTDKTDGETLAREGDFGTVWEGLSARVHAKTELLGLRMGDKTEGGRVRHDNRAQGEIVDTDGCDDETATVGGEDRASATKGVSRGTRWGGDNDAVAGVSSDKVVGDEEVGAEEGLFDKAVKADLVEGEGRELSPFISSHNVEKCARFEGVAPGHKIGDETVDVVAPGSGEETKMAKVHAKNGYVTVRNEVDGAEEGPVTTDGEKEVQRAVGKTVVDEVGLYPMVVQQGDKPLELWAVFIVNVA